MNGPTILVDKVKHVIDAKSQTLGRLASTISILIQGKHKPIFSKHLGDVGDYVVVLNAKDVRLTGAKFKDKAYHHHSGFPGGLKTRTARDYIEVKKNPEFVIENAVRGMLPKNYLMKDRMSKLSIYYGNEMTPSPYTSTSSATKILISDPTNINNKITKANDNKQTKPLELTSWKRL